jgi:hypothetical protein
MQSYEKAAFVTNAKKYAKKEFDRDTLIKLLETWMVEHSKKNTYLKSK